MSREHRDRLLETLFQIRPGEGRLALLLFLQNLCVVGAFIVGRSVRDALFLAHASKAQLPLMYVASAIAVAFVGVLYARVADRARRDRLTAALAIGFALLFCAARLLSGRAGDWIFGALYVLVEVCGALTIIQYWTLANDLFNPRDAKRLFGTIGAGGTVANIVLGGAVGFLARRVGAENLLWLCALLLVGHAVSALRLGQTTGVRSAPLRLRLRGARAGRPGAARVLESPHLRLVAALSAVTFLATTLVDFQFKTLAAAHFDQNALAAFFGHFYAVTGLLALGIQFFGSARFLSRFGVVAALGILPFFLGVGSAAGLVFPTLLAATFTKGSEFVFRYTINDATTQLLYLPVPAHIRAGAKAFIDGVVKPAAIALTGLTLIGTRALALSTTWAVAAASALLCGIWGVVVFRLRAHYVRSLQDTLRRRSLDLDGSRAHVVDGSTSRVLLLALASDDPKEVLNALELLPHAAVADAGTPVVRLLSSPAPQVRAAALAHLGRTGSLQFGNAAFRLFEDPDPGVRAAAIDAFCAIGRDKAVRNVKAFLKDPQGPIRAAAIASMIRYGGLDGVLSAAEALKALIVDPSPLMRAQAARVLGAIGVKNFYQPLLDLMNDPDLSVRRAAIAAAGALQASELTTALIYGLARAETAAEAVAALAAYGPGIEATLERVLSNPLEEPSLRGAVPRVLGRLSTALAVQVITAHLADPDEAVRRSLYKALGRALRRKRGLAVDRKALLKAVDDELLRAYRALDCAEALGLPAAPAAMPREGPAAATALLGSALSEKVAQAEARLITLLGILYPESEIELLFAGLQDAVAHDATRRRAHAVELLDNVLDRPLRRRLFPLLEDLPREVKLRAAREVFPLPPADRTQRLADLLADESAWVRACTLFLCGERREGALRAPIAENLDHASPVVREATVASLEKLIAPEELARALERRPSDESAAVRARVEAALAGARGRRAQAS